MPHVAWADLPPVATFLCLDCIILKHNGSLQYSLAPMLVKTGTISGWHNVTCSCNQTLNIKHFIQRWKNTYCGVQNKTPDHASVTVHKALTLADRSQEKLL